MTLTIKKSELAALRYDFAAEVQKYIAALEEHRFTGNAAPTSYPEVEAAVRRVRYPIDQKKPDDFVADYVIENDDPPPLSLEQRKAAALGELRKAEQAEIDAIIPPEKRRLMDMTFNRALRADPKSDADLKLIADRRAIDAKIEDIQFRYAQQEAALADMT